MRRATAVLLVVGLTVVAVAGFVGPAVGQTDAGNASLSVSASASAVDDDRANVTVTLENTGEREAIAPVARVDGSANWTVLAQTSENGTWRAPSREWLWTELETGESVSATATFDLSGSDGGAEIQVTAVDARNNTARATAMVRAGGLLSGLPLTWLLVALLVVAAVAVGVLYRR